MNKKDKILKMISENKISPEEGEKLLRAIGDDEEKEVELVKFKEDVSRDDKMSKLKGKFIVEIESSSGDNVRIALPLKLAKIGFSMIPSDKIEMMTSEGINLKAILDNITDIIDEIDDDIVNVKSASGDHVRIYIEKR